MKYLSRGIKYLKNLNLNLLKLDLFGNNLERCERNMENFRDIFNELPNTLQHLELLLYSNNLGENQFDMKYLGECI